MADSNTIKDEVLAILRNILGPEPPVMDFPANINGITSALKALRLSLIGVVVVRCRAPQPRFVSNEEWQRVGLFLSAMLNLELIDPKMKNEALLDKALEILFDPKNKCPTDVAKVAKFIYDKLEAENWGADEAEVDETEEAAEETPNNSLIVSRTSPFGTSSNEAKRLTYPHDSDPIYGVKGIMHHILRIRGPKMTTYQIHPNWTNRSAKFFGHGHFEVGECWATQMACLRDGVHGQRIAGIAGSATLGTYSIVISGMYGDLDLDMGDTVHYSGSNSHDNTSNEPIISNGTKALEVSLKNKKPVRVIRSAQSKWDKAPRAGLRYDGLYTIVGYNVERNGKGGAYKRFKLTRNGGQDPINVHAPDQKMVELINRVQEGYTRTRPAMV